MTRPSSCAMGDMKFTRSSDFKVGLLSTIPMAFSCCMCSNDITKNAFLISVIYSDYFSSVALLWEEHA